MLHNKVNQLYVYIRNLFSGLDQVLEFQGSCRPWPTPRIAFQRDSLNWMVSTCKQGQKNRKLETRERGERRAVHSSLKPLLNTSNALDPIRGAESSKPRPLLSGKDGQIPANCFAGVEVLG